MLHPDTHILISPTAFKESISSRGLTELIQTTLYNLGYKNLYGFPGSDGGNGFREAMKEIHGGPYSFFTIPALASKSQRKEPVLMLKDGLEAVIESASVIGLETVPVNQRNPLSYNSKPLGLLILEILKRYPHCRDYWIGVGGTATMDLGLGLLEGLGVHFFDKTDHPIIPNLDNCFLINRIEADGLPDIRLHFIYDVNVSLLGPNNFVSVYGPQKGLMRDISRPIRNFLDDFNFNTSISGAGGGLMVTPSKWLTTSYQRGTTYFSNHPSFQLKLRQSDFIITGEGRLDNQSLQGKWVSVFMEVDQPVLCVCGQSTLNQIPSHWKVRSCTDIAPNQSSAIRQVKKWIRKMIKNEFPQV